MTPRRFAGIILELGAEPAYELAARWGRLSKDSAGGIELEPFDWFVEFGEFDRRAARFFCTWRK